MYKTVLLASFIFPERLDWFIGYLNSKFNIPKNKIFIYQNLTDESKLIVTFKLKIKKDKKLNFKALFPNAILIHKRNTTLYTINALNKLIESQNVENYGNIDHKSIKIDWNEYQNKIILNVNNKLTIFDISQLF